MIKSFLSESYPLTKEVEIFDIWGVYIFSFIPSYQNYAESHPQLELLFVDEGIEELYEDEKTYQLSGGQMFLRKPNSLHKDRCLSPHSTCYILAFTGESPHFPKLYDRVIQLTKNQITQFKELFELYLKEIDGEVDKSAINRRITPKKNVFGLPQIIKNKLELFFISLFSSESKETNELEIFRNYDDPLVDLILKELHERKYEKFSLTKISINLSYSRSYLCRHFKDVTGATIINYFYSIKIEEAKKLLISGKYSIEETSDLLNFDSVQYFSKVFKKYCGLSPSTWRSISTEKKYY